MKIESFNKNVLFNDEKILIEIITESSFSKEIRILMKEGQLMKEHKTPYPIVVHIIEGEIDFGLEGSTYSLNKGDIIALDGNIPHDLKAKNDSIVRLTLSKRDKVERVQKVAEISLG